MQPLTPENLRDEAAIFASSESENNEASLYGVTDGKAIGTYLEQKFIDYLDERYQFEESNAASGIDLPGIAVDIKTTSIKKPQSSCPFKSARQKIFGLGYSLLVFVYEKTDNHESQTGCLDIKHTIYIEKERTADFQMTRGIQEILEREGNKDDLIAFMEDRNLPVDEIEAGKIADELLLNKPMQGYLTISNALQWRLHYSRVIGEADRVGGIHRVL